MKSLLVAITFTVLCYVSFADSQVEIERLLAVPSRPYPEPGGYNIQYHTQDARAASEATGNFGTDGMQNDGLRAGFNVNLQNNKEMGANSPQRFMPGKFPGTSRTSTDGRLDGRSAWRPVNNGGTPIRNVHGPVGQGPNVGGWNSGAPGVNTNGAGGGRGFNTVRNIHQGAPSNAGNSFSRLNKGSGELSPGFIQNLISSLLQKENTGAPLKSGSFADRGKTGNEFVAIAGTSGPSGIQRNNNAGNNFPMRNFADGFGKGPFRDGVRVPNSYGQPAIRQPDSASSVGQTAVRAENVPVAGGLPHQMNNVPNDWVANERTRVVNPPFVGQNYDSRSDLPNSNINRNAWNGPFGRNPFAGGQSVVRPAGMLPFAQPPAVPLRGIPPQQVMPAVRPAPMTTGGGLLNSSPNIVNTNNKIPLGAINSPATTQKQTIVYPEKSDSNASPTGINEFTNQETAHGYSGSHAPKKDSIEGNGSGGQDNSPQLVGSSTKNVKETSVVGSDNGGDTRGTTKSQASNDEIHKSKKMKGKKGKGKKGKGKKGKGKKGKGKKGKGKKGKGNKSKTASSSKSASRAKSGMQFDNDGWNDAAFREIFNEGGHAAKGGNGGITECFED